MLRWKLPFHMCSSASEMARVPWKRLEFVCKTHKKNKIVKCKLFLTQKFLSAVKSSILNLKKNNSKTLVVRHFEEEMDASAVTESATASV